MSTKIDMIQIFDTMIKLEKADGTVDSNAVKALEDMKRDLLEDHAAFLKEACDIFRKQSGVYSSLNFGRVILNSSKVPVSIPLSDLSQGARALMCTLEHFCTAAYFRIPKEMICQMEHIDKRSATKYMKELVDAGSIHLVKEHSGRAAAIYRWDSAYWQIGHANKLQEQDDLVTFKAKGKKPPIVSANKMICVDDDKEKLVCIPVLNKPDKPEKNKKK